MFRIFNLVSILETLGYAGLFFIVLAESGLFIGFFLPGDSLLFTAGFLASQNILNIYTIVLLAVPAAIIGDNIGYAFGSKAGPKIFKKENGLLFNKNNILRSQKFFERHGNKTIILARFMPIVRTFAPILAGVGKMRYQNFIAYNIIGAVIWAAGIPAAGYYLGKTIPNIDKYILPVIAVIVLISVAPGILKAILYYSEKKKYHEKENPPAL